MVLGMGGESARASICGLALAASAFGGCAGEASLGSDVEPDDRFGSIATPDELFWVEGNETIVGCSVDGCRELHGGGRAAHERNFQRSPAARLSNGLDSSDGSTAADTKTPG